MENNQEDVANTESIPLEPATELSIIKWPDQRLHHPSIDVYRFDEKGKKDITQLFLNMSYTMMKNEGIGLAAPQVGVPINFIVCSMDNIPRPFVNPVITESSDETYEWEEGCLSVPGYFEKRQRPKMIVLKCQNIEGVEKEFELHGLMAFAVQHEIDHLHGKVFVDNLSWLKKQKVRKKIKTYLKRRK